MMTKMTRYKPQSDLEDDASSIESAKTEEISSGTTHIRYHMGSHFWRSRTRLEKILIVGWVFQVITILSFFIIMHSHIQTHFPLANSRNRPCLTKECIGISARILESMNSSAHPCSDFYEYACGGWLASTVKPEGKASWGTLSKLSSDNEVIMRKVLEDNTVSPSAAEEKAKIFYRSCMDVNETIESRGAEPLYDLLQKAGGWTLYGNWTADNYDLQADIIRSKNKFNAGALFFWGVAEDDKNSLRYIIQFDQGGLLLPARDYYLNESEKAVPEAYIKYMTKIGVLLGSPKNLSRSVAKDILKFETSLAEFSTPDDQRRDNEQMYHNMTLKSLTTMAPFMDWTVFVNSAFKQINRQLLPSEQVVVYAPDYLVKLSQFLKNLSTTAKGNTTIHNYLTWHIIRNYMGYLSREFRDAYTILEKAQVGVSGGQDEWRECVESTDIALGPALGAMYVRKAFSEEGRTMVTEMLSNIRNSFRNNLQTTSWMSPKTKLAALEKADKIAQMIGYPDYILNKEELDEKFEELEVHEDQFFENNLNVINFKVHENLAKLFEKVNRTKWDVTPPTVNAYYAPIRNNIALPAGILQPPLFSKYNPQALNYGALGVVMGHELSHAFDDQGRNYDKDGNLHAWWEQETVDRFKNRTKCMVDQYSSYILRKEHLKGQLTLGENIADNGGLKASFHAYRNWLDKHRSDVQLPGIQHTPEQLFFLGFGQVWCSTITAEAEHLEILRDSHVLPRFRVLGTLSNSEDFAKAFNCKPHTFMNPSRKCVVW